MSENPAKTPLIGMSLLLALHAICGVVILWLLLKFVPQYEKVFKDLNAKLPNVTVMVIQLSWFVGMYWYLLVPGLAAADFGIMLSLRRMKRTRLMTAWGGLALLAAMLLIGAIMLATVAPLNDATMNPTK